MSQAACPTPEELSRQVSLGPDEQFSVHLDTCEKCAQAFSSESSLIGMFQSLSFGEPSASQVSQVKQALLQETLQPIRLAEPKPLSTKQRAVSPTRLLALAAAILLNAGAAWFLTTSNQTTPIQKNILPTLASVQPGKEALFQHTGTPEDEIVRLQNGTVTVQVTHLQPGQRFRVITGDAEVEVRGTKFDVVAKDDKLLNVFVHEGKVEVRPSSGAIKMLLPSESWDVTKEATPTTQASTMATNEPTNLPTKPEKKPLEVKPKDNNKAAEDAFTQGMSQMTSKEFAKAAESFSQVTSLSPLSPLAEDARFMNAFSLNRAGEKGKAKAAFTSFMAKYPNSSRRGEAAVALGKLYLESGELDEAQIMFESAVDDPAAPVQKSAKDGLASVAKQRKIAPASQPINP